MARSAALLLFGTLAACDPQLYAKQEPPAQAKPHEDEPPSQSPLSAFGLLSKSREPGPFDEPRQAGEGDRAAILELDGALTELEAPFSFSLVGSVEKAVPLRLLVGRLRQLDADPRVPAILLRLRGLEMSIAAAEELGTALASLKKPVHCHFERAGNLEAMVVSRCKQAVIAPGGEIALSGPALLPIYLKGLLDLLGVEADFIHVGAFKGAAEPFTRSEPSPEMRETYDSILDGAYARLVEQIGTGRHVAPEKVKGWIDQAVFTAEQAREAGLVDGISPWEAFRDGASGGAWKRLELEDKPPGGDLFALLGMKPKPRVRGPHLTLLYAVGAVKEGFGAPLGPFEEILPGRLVPAIRAVAADDDVKAIVLRVDSPGGSALGSELIWQAVRDAAGRKPVVVSMGSLAASGGYYISCGATRIFAAPDTLTGSIGVVGGKLVFGAALAKLGVSGTELARGKRALLDSPLRRWNDDERKLLVELMDRIYGTFKARVAEGRKLSPAAVEKIAKGRVWTGADAKTRGLVDELGSLEDAVAFARKQGGLPETAPIDVYPPEPSLLDVLSSFGAVRASLVQQALAQLPAVPREHRRAIARAVDQVLRFVDEPLRAVAIVPSLR